MSQKIYKNGLDIDLSKPLMESLVDAVKNTELTDDDFTTVIEAYGKTEEDEWQIFDEMLKYRPNKFLRRMGGWAVFPNDLSSNDE